MAGIRKRGRSPRERAQEIVQATRALFDEQGLQEASIDGIAKAVGINKALIYRHFASKDELFVLTVTHYLDELAERMREGVPADAAPVDQLEHAVDVFTAFCLEFPAFLDCSLSMMRRPIGDLQDSVSDAVMIRLGQAMVGCLGITADILRRGNDEGVFSVGRPRLRRQPPLHAGARDDAPGADRHRRARGRPRDTADVPAGPGAGPPGGDGRRAARGRRAASHPGLEIQRRDPRCRKSRRSRATRPAARPAALV